MTVILVLNLGYIKQEEVAAITKLSNSKEFRQLIQRKLLALLTINPELVLARSMIAKLNPRMCEPSQMSVETPIRISSREITRVIAIFSKTHS